MRLDRRRRLVQLASGALLVAAGAARPSWARFDLPWEPERSKPHGPYRIEDRLRQFADPALRRLMPRFGAASAPFPPAEVALLAFKDTHTLQLYSRAGRQPWRLVCTYPILAASGVLGPKLREGDEQVPEGIYRITLLNPNSRFHVSLRLDYPNAFDQHMALTDGRSRPGGDIMIHGKAVSAGCLAMGDRVAEELFTLAALVTPAQMRVVISPTDFRDRGWLMPISGSPDWTVDLYRMLEGELTRYPRPR